MTKQPSIALIGTGKTGQEIVRLLDSSRLIGPFNNSNPPTPETLEKADIILLFTPGTAMGELVPMLRKLGKPVVSGSTGFTWPSDLDAELRQKNLTWVDSSNFALGLHVLRRALKIMGSITQFYPDATFEIEETHQASKKDAPSGTALSWQGWLGAKTHITSHRVGERLPEHHLTIRTAFENISISHQAHSRQVYAQGALWCIEQLVQKKFTRPGLILFEDLVDEILFNDNTPTEEKACA